MTLDPVSVLVQGFGFDSSAQCSLNVAGVGSVPTTYVNATHVRCHVPALPQSAAGQRQLVVSINGVAANAVALDVTGIVLLLARPVC